jgi:glycine dehydrogenase
MNLFQMQNEEFRNRHIGPTPADTEQMLNTIGVDSIDTLIHKTIPASIRLKKPLNLPNSISEQAFLNEIKRITALNKVYKTYIEQGYFNTITPSVILRNVFENPGWYTQYTPYQAEISQGRLESLLNFQTMVADLTGLAIANASLLDEATAAAEAMIMLFHHANKTENATKHQFFVDEHIWGQTKDVLITRAKPLGINLVFGQYQNVLLDDTFFGAFVQCPAANGVIPDYRGFIANVHAVGAYAVMATDLMALTLLTSPGEIGADVAIGSAQRFGVPMGYG